MENQAGAAALQPATNAESSAPKKPWIAYNVIDKPGLTNRIWMRVGMAWLNRDGSINVILDALPVGGRIQLRPDDRERRTEARGPLSVAASAQNAQE
jgi:hypothetical protein